MQRWPPPALLPRACRRRLLSPLLHELASAVAMRWCALQHALCGLGRCVVPCFMWSMLLGLFGPVVTRPSSPCWRCSWWQWWQACNMDPAVRLGTHAHSWWLWWLAGKGRLRPGGALQQGCAAVLHPTGGSLGPHAMVTPGVMAACLLNIKALQSLLSGVGCMVVDGVHLCNTATGWSSMYGQGPWLLLGGGLLLCNRAHPC
jgi:hypothetical protein